MWIFVTDVASTRCVVSARRAGVRREQRAIILLARA